CSFRAGDETNHFSRHSSSRRRQSDQRNDQRGDSGIALYPFTCVRENSASSRADWFVFEPVFKVFRERQSRRVSAVRIFCQTLQTNHGKLAIYLPIQETRFSRVGLDE